MNLPMPTPITLYASAAALALGLAFGAAGGMKWSDARRLQCEQARAAEQAAAAQQQTRRLAAALTAADASVNTALQQRDAADARAKEIARELSRQKLLSGRACLSGGAVRLLNSHPAIGMRLPAPPASPARAAAAAAADSAEPGHAAAGRARAPIDAAEDATDTAAGPPQGGVSPLGGQREDASVGATDSDLAAWALDTMTLYQTCRARIDALRQWDAALSLSRP